LECLIDTNVLVAIECDRQRLAGATKFNNDAPVAIAAISASELLHSVHRARSARRRELRRRFVEDILERVKILPFDLEVARIHAQICADLKSRCKLIGAHDLLIAETALANRLTLIIHNRREFERVGGLEFGELWSLELGVSRCSDICSGFLR